MLNIFISDSVVCWLILICIGIVMAGISVIRLICFKRKNPESHLRMSLHDKKTKGRILTVGIVLGIAIAVPLTILYVKRENAVFSVNQDMIDHLEINIEEVEGLSDGSVDNEAVHEYKSYATVFLKKYEEYDFHMVYEDIVWGNGDKSAYTPSYYYQVYEARSESVSKEIIKELQSRIQKEEYAEGETIINEDDKFLWICEDGPQKKFLLIRNGEIVINIDYMGNGDIESWADNYLS